MAANVQRQFWSLILMTLLAVSLLAGCAKQESAPEQTANDSGMGFRIGYAEGVTEVEDPNALQKAVDAAYAAASEEGVGLEYREQAVSENGIDFECYIGNSNLNSYDMFIAVYGDAELTDELYLSQLIRPGTAFDHITLNHKLPVGDNEAYVVFTQIVEEDGEQKIRGQVVVTMDFVVL